ncbi:CHAD domain-containing protein [Occallatibacter riparius]|uniref:CHAD domain-containing protein n=1 Tax=Occallatibacter riparius TaxID=1002689 RepID=A0A9J7BVH9_9BACT|nr:CHAD domain-containing protein [Occallatibacter riparius]UWZ86545.1 CHAD domain-containing protein [Occallatibacter riparius]
MDLITAATPGPLRGSNLPMNVDVQAALKALRKLHKKLKDFPAHPAPEEVHKLRTETRRLEAVVHTFSSDSDREAQRLLKLTKPVRKALGKVRDMDVFIAKTHQIGDDSTGEGLVRLTEEIARRREKHVVHLSQIIAQRRKPVRRAIRRFEHHLESGNAMLSPVAPQILGAELDHWPRIDAANLHEFRIRAKELRYMLQLSPETYRQRIDALGEVKDLAGEWHDWVELHELAKKSLDPAEDGQILRELANITREKLRASLTAANRLRRSTVEFKRAA